MVRDVYIIRHGNAYDEDYGKVDDIDRNLNVKGVNEAHDVGSCIKDSGVTFDVIHSSPASRALQTAVIIARTMNHDMKMLIVNNDLYLASVDNLINTIKKTENKHKSIAIFSHNPGISDLAWKKNQLINVTTCGVVHYKVDVDDLKDTTLETLEFQGYGCPEKLIFK